MSEGAAELVAGLRAQSGKDIWLFGGGGLFRSLAEAKLVDTVELGVAPVLLGGGIPLSPTPANRIMLELREHKAYNNGCLSLTYAIRYPDVARASGRQRRLPGRRPSRSDSGA